MSCLEIGIRVHPQHSELNEIFQTTAVSRFLCIALAGPRIKVQMLRSEGIKPSAQ